jgi:hypothetical protein
MSETPFVIERRDVVLLGTRADRAAVVGLAEGVLIASVCLSAYEDSPLMWRAARPIV